MVVFGKAPISGIQSFQNLIQVLPDLGLNAHLPLMCGMLWTTLAGIDAAAALVYTS